jgi:rod shape determining protein RodA
MSRLEQDMDLLESHIRTINYRNLKRIDWQMVAVTLFLILVGLVTLYSASRSASGDAPFYLNYFIRQTAFFVLGAGLALLLVATDYRALVSFAPVFYTGAVGLMLLVPIIGFTAKGGQHWLRYGIIGLQPSELGKLALVFMLAWYCGRLGDRIQRLPYYVLGLILIGLVLVLILVQGDLGTAVVVIPLGLIMLFVAGARLRYQAALIAAGLVLAVVGYYNLEKLPLSEHQKTRIESFFNPKKDPEYAKRAGYQAIQTTIAVGSGQLWGRGYGKGTQTHHRFLPEYHTDMIFALLAEEMGFVGGASVIGLFALFLFKGLSMARSCPDLAGSLLAVGCVTLLAIHVMINVAIALNLLPITGLPLPFLSYGGSFCLTTMMCVGTLLSVNVRKGFFD